MPPLDFIPATDVPVFVDWRRSPAGILLQVGDLPEHGTISKPSIVFRVDNPVTDGITRSILGLENGERGKLYSAAHTQVLPGVDVSALAEIGVRNAKPRLCHTDPVAGDLVVILDENALHQAAWFVVANYPQGSFAGYVCIFSAISSYRAGSVYPKVPLARAVLMGEPEVRRKKQVLTP